MAQETNHETYNIACKIGDIVYQLGESQIRYFKVTKVLDVKGASVLIAEIEQKKHYISEMEGYAYPVPDLMIGSDEMADVIAFDHIHSSGDSPNNVHCSRRSYMLDDGDWRFHPYSSSNPPVFVDH